MTAGDIVTYCKQIAPDAQQSDAAWLNFTDAGQRRIIKKVLWPDCWMTTQTIAGQQEYPSLPLLQVHAVYVGGQLATQTNRATLEGRQIGLYSQLPSPGAAPVIPSAVFSGTATLGGTIKPGDTLTTIVGGTAVPYTVLATDADFQILAQSIAYALSQNVTLQNQATFQAITANPVQIGISQLPNTGGPLSLAVGLSGGATETYVASGAALSGASNGSGGAPGTIGPFAPTWVIAQEPASYPVQNTWYRSIRPDAAPWGTSCDQPPRYYWHGGRAGIVPNTAISGVTIAIDCVRSPDLITTMQQALTVPEDWRECIASDVLRQAYMGDGDSKHVALAQMWESSYKDYEKEIILWRGTFEGEAPGSYKMQTQRFRMGLAGGNRFQKRRR
jgi:hypothetical protein